MSKFFSEDEWIERRKKLANFFTERADLHTFIPNLPFMVAPAAEGEEGSEADADDDEVDEAEAGGDAEAGLRTETPGSGSGTGVETTAPQA